MPVPEEDLPVLLPEDAEFLPTGESPLKRHEGFWNDDVPGLRQRRRARDRHMDTFVDSSWYQYRYLSPHFDEGPFDSTKRRQAGCPSPSTPAASSTPRCT